MSTTHERPGVYSVYEASGTVSAGARNGVAAIVAVSEGDQGLYSLGSLAEAETAFGSEDALAELVGLLLRNGAARVLAVPVKDTADYKAAFDLLAGEEDVKVVVCDSTEPSVQRALRESVMESSKVQRERIAVVCGGAEEEVTELAQRAKDLNSERVVLTAPADHEGNPASVAAAVAGCICGETDPAVPLGGAVLLGLTGLNARFSESDIDTLIRAGVTPVETVGGQCAVVRGVTTRTKTQAGDAEDETWRDLSTILVVDDVVPTVRNALRSRFTRAKNTAQVRGAIRSQVIVELERKLAAEIITGYGEVTARQAEGNPTVCQVEFSFNVAHGLNQIWLKAMITV